MDPTGPLTPKAFVAHHPWLFVMMQTGRPTRYPRGPRQDSTTEVMDRVEREHPTLPSLGRLKRLIGTDLARRNQVVDLRA